MKPLAETPSSDAAREPAPGTENEPAVHVLIVDDDAAVRDVAVRALRYENLDATSVASGEEAIARVRDASFDCIVLDLTMPSMSGPDTFRALRALSPALPIVLCSGWRTDEVDGLLGGGGRSVFLRKPFTPRQLATAVHSVLET